MSGKERAGYTVTMFVIDVSPSMGEEHEVELVPGHDGESRSMTMTKLEWSLKYVKHKIQQMIFTGRKSDKCGVILFGTEGTKNAVSDVHGGYDHVTEFLPIHQPTARTLHKLDTLKSSSVVGDPLDGIIVALSTQQNELEKKPSWTRKAIVITDGESPMEVDEDDLSGVTDKLNQWNVGLTLVGVDFEDENYSYEGPEKSNIKIANEKFWNKFVSLTQSGSMGTLAYALQVTQSPDIKITKSTLSKTTLSIGDIHLRPDESIQIMVKTGKATATVRPPSLKKFAMRTDGSGGPKESQHQPQPSKPTMPSLGDVAPLEMRTQYVVKESDDIDDPKANKPIRDFDDEDEEDVSKDTFQDSQRVEKEDLTRAYKYGSTWIPIEDESADRLSTVKGLEVIGFSYEDLWTREWSMGEVYYIFADDQVPRAQVAFASFVRAMGGYEIVDKKTGEATSRPLLSMIRKVTNDGSPPKVGVACARSLEGIDYLVWVRMPFADDIRRYNFPSLEILKDKNGIKKTGHPNLPTAEMMDAMSELVDAGDLSAAGELDEEGNRLPWFDPSEAVHPAVHRIKEAIFHAAITNDIEQDPIPPPHPEILKFIHPPEDVIMKSRGPAQRCKSLFDVKPVPPRLKMRKKAKGAEDGLSTDADVPLTLADLMAGDAYIPDYSPSPTLVNASEYSRGATLAASPSESLRPKASLKGYGEDTMDLDVPLEKGMIVTGQDAKPGRIIGNAHPVHDFEENTARGDLVTKAVQDMGKVIPEIVESSFSSQRFQEALQCMRVMRDVALKEDEVDEWNSFIKAFKKQCRSSNFKHSDFWDHVRKEGVPLSLIHEEEAQENGGFSEISLNGSKKFIQD